jgi:preprotein translocase subunit SecE
MIERIKQFFRDVKIETGKVVFPSRDELIGSTWVVIITIFMVSTFLGIVDFILTRAVKMALG